MDNGRPFRISGSEDKKRSRASRSSSGKTSESAAPEEQKASKRAASTALPVADPVATEATSSTAESRIAEPVAEKGSDPASTRSKGRNKRMLGWVATVVVAGLILIGGYTVWSSFGSASVLPGADKYQAVTTVDGQIFFGKVKLFGSEYVEINDGYYLQPAVSESSDGQVDTGRLVRLSNRLYGPNGTIVIPKNQVLSFEVLDPDGQIVQMMGDGSN